jgi:putative two-component system response regulator
VLVVDEMDVHVRLLEKALGEEGYQVFSAADAEAALTRAEVLQPDVVIMNVALQGRDGFVTCTAIKQQPSTSLTPVVLMAVRFNDGDRLRAIEAGADDFFLTPVDGHELRARVRALVRLKRSTDELDSAEAVILSLALTVEARDAATDGHCQRLAAYGMALGRRLGLGDEDLEALHRGGYLHDLGKIATPDAVLNKPGPLTPSEFAQMKQHPVIGEQLCGNLRVLARVRPIVRHHHERLDGSGYPDGLQGDAVPLLAQVIGVVDVYDALTTWRPYRDAFTPEAAFDQLRQEVQRGWRSRTIVDAFIAAATEGDLSLELREHGLVAQ